MVYQQYKPRTSSRTSINRHLGVTRKRRLLNELVLFGFGYHRLRTSGDESREQFEFSGSAVGLGAATRATKWRHGAAAAVVDLLGRIPSRGRASMHSTARFGKLEGGRRAWRCAAAIRQASKRGVIGEGEYAPQCLARSRRVCTKRLRLFAADVVPPAKD